MKSKKGMSLLIWLIIIVILILFAGSIGAYLIGLGGSIAHKATQYGEQIGVATKILPASWYDINMVGAVKGQLIFTVKDKNTSVYVTDFDPSVSYKVYDNNVQTTVFSVKEFPIAYIAVVADPSSSKLDNNFWTNLTKIKFPDALVAPISVMDIPAEKAAFDEASKATKPVGTGSADYWGALARAGESLPTITAKRNLGPNFLAVILVSNGSCDVNCADEGKISAALNAFSTNTHFYMLRSDCNVPITNGANAEQDRSNTTLGGYSALLAKAECYENQLDLINNLTENDLAPIILEYEPKFVATYIGDIKPHNITLEVTKRTGVLGAEAAYSGKSSYTITPGY